MSDALNIFPVDTVKSQLVKVVTLNFHHCPEMKRSLCNKRSSVMKSLCVYQDVACIYAPSLPFLRSMNLCILVHQNKNEAVVASVVIISSFLFEFTHRLNA
jgi:hypothetical protein